LGYNNVMDSEALRNKWQQRANQVTKSELWGYAKNALERGNIPGVSVYTNYIRKEYFGKEISELRKELKRLSVFYPLGIKVSDKREYLLRSVASIRYDGSLIFRGEVPEGSVVRLMISSKESCLSSAAQAAQIAVNSLRGKRIRFALILNSFARFVLLGRLAAQEIKLVRDIVGDVPLAGIYTLAEEAPLSSVNYNFLGETYFHNNSIAVLAVAE